MREPQKIERPWFALTICAAISPSESTEANQISLQRMQVEPKLDEPFLQFSLKTACINIMLESQYDIIRISHYNQIARCSSLSPLLGPKIQHVVEIDVGQQRGYDSPNAKGNFEFDRVIGYR